MYFSDIADDLSGIVRTLSVFDVIDVLLLAFIIYKLLKFVKETRAEQLLKGIFIVAIVLIIVRQFTLRASRLLSDTFLNIGAMAIIVMFQPELRRFLDRMGRIHVSKSLTFNIGGTTDFDREAKLDHFVDEVIKACVNLSKTATGALIVIERQTKLNDYIYSGTVLHAVPSVELFENIFFPNTPLHDGAVIMRGGEILAAACFLPKPQHEELVEKGLGSRHRAAIGLSEVSDALVIVVSEETGGISVAENGVLTRNFDAQKLYKKLKQDMLVFEEINTKVLKKAKKPAKNKTDTVNEKPTKAYVSDDDKALISVDSRVNI